MKIFSVILLLLPDVGLTVSVCFSFKQIKKQQEYSWSFKNVNLCLAAQKVKMTSFGSPALEVFSKCGQQNPSSEPFKRFR